MKALSTILLTLLVLGGCNDSSSPKPEQISLESLGNTSSSNYSQTTMPSCENTFASWWGTWTECYGSFTNSNGETYEGEWRDNMKHGQGTSSLVGRKYVGEWREDEKNGQGTYNYGGGDKYVGEWQDNMMNGQGTFFFGMGDKYVGEWKGNMMHGKGIYTWIEGNYYDGEWKNDFEHGYGSYTFINGNKYVGEFRDGQSVDIDSYQIAYENSLLEERIDEQKQSLVQGSRNPTKGFIKLLGDIFKVIAEVAIGTVLVAGEIANSPAGQAALANKEAKNQKIREQNAYNKGKRDGKRKVAKQKAAMCQLNRNC